MKKSVIYNLRFAFILLSFCMILVSCEKSDPVEPDPNRTVLVYMAADNSLSSDSDANIEQMLEGMKNKAGRLVIYLDPAYDVPHLMTIKGGKNPVVDTLETYPEENSASVEVLSRVIGDTRRLFSSQSYGLILWSHGMGWLPESYKFNNYRSFKVERRTPLRTKYFGEDRRPGNASGTSYIDIKQLSGAITGKFDFILFDACFMSSIEVLYELRERADYFIASPAEIISDGFPYEQICPYLWGDVEDMKKICISFFNYYNTHPDPTNAGWQSATVALVKSDELEGLMASARDALKGRTDFQGLNVWRYPLSYYTLPNVFYDLGDYINAVADDSGKAAFQKQLNKAVIYKAATPKFFGATIPADKYSGLSTYIPLSQWSNMNTTYFELEWPQHVYDR